MSVVRTRGLASADESFGTLEERALIRAAAAGDGTAAEMLLVAHHGIIASLARRYRSGYVAHEDLIAEGQLALLETIERFDQSLGTRFASYARWRVRTSMRSLARAAKRNQALPESGAWMLEAEARRKDEAESVDGGPDLIDWSDQPERKLALAQLRLALRNLLETVSARLSLAKRVVLHERILADEPLTLLELAQRLSVSAERVRQIEMAVERELLRSVAGLAAFETLAALAGRFRGDDSDKRSDPLLNSKKLPAIAL